MTFTTEELNVAKSKAIISTMTLPDVSFYSHITFAMKYVWSYTETRTACTDGITIYLNPDFFMSLDNEERGFLLVHEACHIAFMHGERLYDRDHQRFNIAADHVINLQLIERGFKMPKCGFADKKYSGMSTEEVYDLLPTQQQEDFEMDIRPSNTNGDGSDDDEQSSSHAPGSLDPAIKREIENIIVRAAMQAKMDNNTPGSIPGEIQIFLNNLLAPKLPWNVILRRFIKNLAKTNYSFLKFNRKYLPKVYLPTLTSKKLINIAIAADASGSVSDQEFKRIVTEAYSLLKSMKPDKMTIIQFDTRLISVDTVKNVQQLMAIDFKGRGGTDVTPVIDWAKENKPSLLLIFTDGYFDMPEIDASVPIIWLIHNNSKFKAPTGKVIHYVP